MKSNLLVLATSSLLFMHCAKKSTSIDSGLEAAKSNKHKIYTCHQTAGNPSLKIVIDEYSDNRDSAIADVSITAAGMSVRTYTRVEMFADNEGGFDYGVSNKSFEILLILPPNELPNSQIAARYTDYSTGKAKKEQTLICTVATK